MTTWASDDVSTLLRPSPVVEFFKLTASNGDVKRIANFYDPDVSVVDGYVRFDSADWLPLPVARGDIEEGTDGYLPQLRIACVDPDRTLLGWLLSHDALRGGQVEFQVIRLSDLETPSLAESWDWSVREARSLDGPARVEVVFGPAPVLSETFPRKRFSRLRCGNHWHQRFSHAGWRNRCNYPSDDFGPDTCQGFKGSSDSRLELSFGWETINASTGVWSWDHTRARDPGYMECQIVASARTWDDSTRTGPYAFKPLGGNLDIDVWGQFEVSGGDGSMAGLLIQSVYDGTSWIFVGLERQSSVNRGLIRVTNAGSSTDYVHAGTSHHDFRIVRDGTSWSIYRRATTVGVKEPSSSSWEFLRTVTLSMASDTTLRVGVAFGGPSTPSTTGKAHHIRFGAGGLTTCPLTFAGCETRNMLHRYNGHPKLPDAPVSF